MGDKKPPTMKRSKTRRGKTRMADMGSYPGMGPGGPQGKGKCPSCGMTGGKHKASCRYK